jgi:hypothetical protein
VQLTFTSHTLTMNQQKSDPKRRKTANQHESYMTS